VLGRELGTLFAGLEASVPSVADLLEAAGRKSVNDERWHERADGSVFWGSCTLSPLHGKGLDGYAVLSHNATDRKQYERSLERQNDRLKEFTDILSHDLRTPLSVIEGRLELYRETGEEEHADAIDGTVRRMEKLVDDLLRVARQGRMVEEPEPTDLGRVLETAREGTLPPPVNLVYEPAPRVVADPDRLCELFANLLRNAWEHGGESVTVRVGPFEDGRGFYVEDDGPGIPEGERERVFEHGYTTRDDGTGYGLSIVRSIVGAHGWDVAVVDTAGDGARFEVTGVEFVD
jgi:signal transduction histidine kinase